jgi:hypothetical protein
MNSNGHVQISDFSDRELLAIMLDLGGEVTPTDLAARIYGWKDIEGEDKEVVTRGKRCVSSRLAWMRRFGLVESWVEVEPPKLRTWKVSIPGSQMLGARLPAGTVNALDRLTDTYDLTLANVIGEKLVKAGQISGTAMRRELQFQIARRKRGS